MEEHNRNDKFNKLKQINEWNRVEVSERKPALFNWSEKRVFLRRQQDCSINDRILSGK